MDLSAMLKHQLNEIFTRPYTEPRSPFCSLAIPGQLTGGWANMDIAASIDDAGLRGAGGLLQTPLGVPFRTPAGSSPNCLFLSQWQQDQAEADIPLTGSAEGVYLLMTGNTFPQASRMEHGRITVAYTDGAHAQLSLKNPETWWPIEQDYLLDDYLFIDEAPLPPRVDLATGGTRLLDLAGFKGHGREVPGGAATILFLPLDPRKPLASLKVEAQSLRHRRGAASRHSGAPGVEYFAACTDFAGRCTPDVAHGLLRAVSALVPALRRVGYAYAALRGRSL